jgi:hypothetical protein
MSRQNSVPAQPLLSAFPWTPAGTTPTDPGRRKPDVRLASGDLQSRIEVSPARDELDAIIMGTNLLAEDLQIIYEELEQRVEVRTQLLHEAHLEMQKMAMQDPLTGLANRSALLAALKSAQGDEASDTEHWGTRWATRS